MLRRGILFPLLFAFFCLGYALASSQASLDDADRDALVLQKMKAKVKNNKSGPKKKANSTAKKLKQKTQTLTFNGEIEFDTTTDVCLSSSSFSVAVEAAIAESVSSELENVLLTTTCSTSRRKLVALEDHDVKLTFSLAKITFVLKGTLKGASSAVSVTQSFANKIATNLAAKAANLAGAAFNGIANMANPLTGSIFYLTRTPTTAPTTTPTTDRPTIAPSTSRPTIAPTSDVGTGNDADWYLGAAGASCTDTCLNVGSSCSDSTLVFQNQVFTEARLTAIAGLFSLTCPSISMESLAQWGHHLPQYRPGLTNCVYDSGGGSTCDAVPDDNTNQRFCYCPNATGIALSAAPVTAAPTTKAVWYLGAAGASCTSTCLAAGSSCSDSTLVYQNEITTEDKVKTLAGMFGLTCPSISMESLPQWGHHLPQYRPGLTNCVYDSGGGSTCDAVPDDNTNQRFCYCP